MDKAELTTQMYFPGELRNERDSLLRLSLDPGALIASLVPSPDRRRATSSVSFFSIRSAAAELWTRLCAEGTRDLIVL